MTRCDCAQRQRAALPSTRAAGLRQAAAPLTSRYSLAIDRIYNNTFASNTQRVYLTPFQSYLESQAIVLLVCLHVFILNAFSIKALAEVFYVLE